VRGVSERRVLREVRGEREEWGFISCPYIARSSQIPMLLLSIPHLTELILSEFLFIISPPPV